MKLKLKAWLAAAAAAFSVSAGADILPTGLQPYEFVFEKFASTDFIAGFQNCVSHTDGKVSLFERCARQVRKVLEERYQAAYDEASSRCGASQECRSALAESFQYYEIYRSQMKNYLSLALDPESLIGQRVANGFEFYDLQKQTVLLDMISSGKTPGDAAFPSIKIGTKEMSCLSSAGTDQKAATECLDDAYTAAGMNYRMFYQQLLKNGCPNQKFRASHDPRLRTCDSAMLQQSRSWISYRKAFANYISVVPGYGAHVVARSFFLARETAKQAEIMAEVYRW